VLPFQDFFEACHEQLDAYTAGCCTALQDPEEHPVSDIAQQGRPFGRGLAPELWPEALVRAALRLPAWQEGSKPAGA
jgi:hypothetical protein